MLQVLEKKWMIKTVELDLARKIGMDLALTKFDYNSSAKSILICTDADCTVDSNYLSDDFTRV